MSLTDLSGHYTIDPDHTTISFIVRHAMITKIRGTFPEFSADFTADPDNFENSSAHATIAAASVDTHNAQRDEHVRSGDFFDVEKYPEITFASTKVAVDGEMLVLTGDLTIKGVTQSVTIPFDYLGQSDDPFGNTRVGFSGSTKLNRKDFGLSFNAALETGGVLVGETVTVELDISAIKD